MTNGRPGPIVPTPAFLFSTLRGRRVIVGVPGIGFRADLRADDPVTQSSRTFIPILTEQDYYRAEVDQIEVFAPLVPIDRVWVEQVGEEPMAARHSLSPLDAPAVREPTLVVDVDALLGRRLVQAVADGFVRDLRAASMIYVRNDGIPCVRTCNELDWYRWALGGTTPATSEEPAASLWAE